MYKLFYSPGACSMAIHIALNECGQSVELQKVDIQKGDTRTPEYLKMNPRGQVPVLLDGDRPMVEGAAILISVLEKNKSPLLPSSGAERVEALEWLMFCNATLHPAYARCFFLMKNGPTDGQPDPTSQKLMNVAIKMINKLWEDVEHRLSDRPYLCGNNVTIADILATVIANWSANLPQPIQFGPKTKKLFQTIIERPGYKKALSDEKVEYKVAA